MSASSQFIPPPHQSGNSAGRTVLIVLLSVGLVSMMCCSGVCAGVFVLLGGSGKTLAQVKATIKDQMPAPLVAPKWEDDWIAIEMLTRGYTTALDTVAAAKRVTERWGKRLEPD